VPSLGAEGCVLAALGSAYQILSPVLGSCVPAQGKLDYKKRKKKLKLEAEA